MELCRNLLHPKTSPGLCAPCRRETQRRYTVSPKGKARRWRYRYSPKGRAANRRYETGPKWWRAYVNRVRNSEFRTYRRIMMRRYRWWKTLEIQI